MARDFWIPQMRDSVVHRQPAADAKDVDRHQQRIKIKHFPMSIGMQRSPAGRALRLIPQSRSSSFPESAVEWKASASIAELPVIAAATYLQICDRNVGDDRRVDDPLDSRVAICGPCQLAKPCISHQAGGWMLPRLGTRFLRGTPLAWQSAHLTVWMLCGLFGLLNVVSIFSTSSPQLESCGWQVVQEARVLCPCFSWHARQLNPS